MRLKIKVIPNAKKNQIVEDKEILKVYVKARPVNGKANQAVVETLGKFFKVKKSRVKIIAGVKSREKIIEIL